ncbi:MAG TPA: endonuclease/exonuclease/phosphatase family protein [Micromonosporaceae bacterium]
MLDHSGSAEPASDGDRPAGPSQPDRQAGVRWHTRAITWLVRLSALGLLAWAVVRWFGLERGALAVPALAFTPYAALAAPLVLLVAVATRRWWAVAAAAVACALLAATVLPRAVGAPTELDGPRVRVLSVNLRVGGADPAEVAALVRDREVDLLTLQEFTPAAQQALAAAGLDGLLPYRAVSPRDGYGGSAIYARFPLAEVAVRVNPDGEFTQVSAVVHLPEAAPVRVESVHPVPPVNPAATNAWVAGLRGQPAATMDGPLRILSGDFNATVDHAELRRLIRTGYRDAADQVGAGLVPTWPYHGRRALVTPKVTIDHILVDQRIGVVDFTAVTVTNTDHRAVLATLVLPTG